MDPTFRTSRREKTALLAKGAKKREDENIKRMCLCVYFLCSHSFVKAMLKVLLQEVPMRELLIAAAERAIRYLEGLNERDVGPDPTVVARLSEPDIPLSAYPSPADETVALLDS